MHALLIRSAFTLPILCMNPVYAAGWAQDINLANLDNRGLLITGGSDIDSSGVFFAASGVGDVNGDGISDFAIGPRDLSVVFGRADGAPLTLAQLGVGGIPLKHNTFSFVSGNSSFRTQAGTELAGSGDFDGDGLFDVLVGANTGDAHILFGKRDVSLVDLDLSNDQSLEILHSDSGSIGRKVSGAGDFNGDGFSDVIVSDSEDAVHVVLGRSGRASIDLGAIGAGSVPIRLPPDSSSPSVAGVGDFNGDGLDDIGVSPNSSETQFIVFGKTDNTAIDLADTGTQAIEVSATTVRGAGDVNGDGFSDVILWRRSEDAAHISFGYDTALVPPEPSGFLIQAGETVNSRGIVASAGDFNADGLGDILIGGSDSSAGMQTVAHLVYGKAEGVPVSLDQIGNLGFAITSEEDALGVALRVSAAGDANGDGLSDILLGWLGSGLPAKSAVVFGEARPPQSTYQTFLRNGFSSWRAVGVVGDGSDTGYPGSRAWVRFLDGEHPGRPASRVIVSIIRNADAYEEAVAPVSWLISSDRENWTTAAVRFRYAASELPDDLNESALQLVYSVDGNPPFLPLPSIVEPGKNQITALGISALGYFFLGSDEIFADDFE